MIFRRLRGRLNRMERQASHAMSEATQTVQHADRTLHIADQTMLKAQQEIIAVGNDLIDDIADGVSIKLVRKGDNTIMDFVMGQCDELPLQVVIDIEADAEES